jgi:hypothetical protein
MDGAARRRLAGQRTGPLRGTPSPAAPTGYDRPKHLWYCIAEGVGWTALRAVVSRVSGTVRFAGLPLLPLGSNPRVAFLRNARGFEREGAPTGYDRPKHLWDFERRGWDSNPRVLADAGFQDRCIEPLCHPS